MTASRRQRLCFGNLRWCPAGYCSPPAGTRPAPGCPGPPRTPASGPDPAQLHHGCCYSCCSSCSERTIGTACCNAQQHSFMRARTFWLRFDAAELHRAGFDGWDVGEMGEMVAVAVTLWRVSSGEWLRMATAVRIATGKRPRCAQVVAKHALICIHAQPSQDPSGIH